jgi:UDP-N-acetyl-D-mannosaminuronic acid dehydrogenase
MEDNDTMLLPLLKKAKIDINTWRVDKIAVVGPGIVGMPMAALLANAKICIGSDQPACVVVIQRNSPTSGWKVDAVNSARSPIGGIEPGLNKIVSDTVAEGLLRASHDYSDLRDADVILVCVQTDKNGLGPNYGPLFEALANVAKELKNKPNKNIPLIIFESTLAPSSMVTSIKDYFASYGLEEGRDIFLGNSPNRVMPGRLIERVAASDKVIGGLNPTTPKLIEKLYKRIVTKGELHLTNSMTAEIIKTFENTYRDVRIAFSAEIVRYCDVNNIHFYQVRSQVNDRLSQIDNASKDPNAVPSGGILIPTIGVGGHCLPKDGILLLWREIESGRDMSESLILESRRINDESPGEVIRLTERYFGDISGKSVTLMGTAYRFNSEDTRNSPTLNLARLLLDKGCKVIMHDPYVKPDDQKLIKFGLEQFFTRDMQRALKNSEILIFCTSHKIYADEFDLIIKSATKLKGIVDGCNLYRQDDFSGRSIEYTGIGRGTNPPSPDFVDFVYNSFRVVELGVANEVQNFINFLNERFVKDDFNRVEFLDVQKIARTCVTGCDMVCPGPIEMVPFYKGFSSRLAGCAQKTSLKEVISGVYN